MGGRKIPNWLLGLSFSEESLRTVSDKHLEEVRNWLLNLLEKYEDKISTSRQSAVKIAHELDLMEAKETLTRVFGEIERRQAERSSRAPVAGKGAPPAADMELGRASWRESVWQYVLISVCAVILKPTNTKQN